MGLFDLLKTKESATTIPEDCEILFVNEFLIVGESYECRKNKKHKRINVIKKTKVNSPVHIERYLYNKKPAYMIVNTKLDLDLGVLSAGAADWLSDYYNKGTVFAELVDKYESSFHVRIAVCR